MFQVKSITTPIFKLNDDLESFITNALLKCEDPKENQILCITSKIISLAEKRIVLKNKISATEPIDNSKAILVREEADIFLCEGSFGIPLTIKHGLLIANAGIDESNAEGDYYILYPKKPFDTAKNLCHFIKKKFELKNFGVLVTDSRTQPLRRGVSGVALAYWGFEGIKNYIGERDLFGREIKYTSVHVADAIAASAVLVMGESAECTPLAIATETNVRFVDVTNPNEGIVDRKDDLYRSIFKYF